MHAKSSCELGFATLDIGRAKRRGFPEVIYAPGKTDCQIKDIAAKIISCRQTLLITRISQETYAYLTKSFPRLQYKSEARIAYLEKKSKPRKKGSALVVCAGTSDIPVAEEAAVVLEVMGNRVKRLYDVGVAGVHRVIDKKELLRKARVIVVVAGMEGALASIVSGLVAAPVIAVPTSVGYGANFEGLSALLTMLNSCSPGVAVVNIDNGFGAGYFASLVTKRD
jgi:NCAIR mutase (PurE)-related protein